MKRPTNSTHASIQNFIQHLTEKNYAMADKYLKAAVERTLLKQMNETKPKNIFKTQ